MTNKLYNNLSCSAPDSISSTPDSIEAYCTPGTGCEDADAKSLRHFLI